MVAGVGAVVGAEAEVASRLILVVEVAATRRSPLIRCPPCGGLSPTLRTVCNSSSTSLSPQQSGSVDIRRCLIETGIDFASFHSVVLEAVSVGSTSHSRTVSVASCCKEHHRLFHDNFRRRERPQTGQGQSSPPPRGHRRCG